MGSLLPGPIPPSNQGPPSRGEGIDPIFYWSELTGNDQGDPHRQVPRIPHAGNPIPLLYPLFLTFTLVPLFAVLGQHILSSFCWVAHSIPVCAAHTLTGYLLTYLATMIGLLLLSPCWLIMAVNEPASCAIRFAASPIGSLALRWLMDGDNDPRPLGLLWILLAMAVGQGIVRAISHHALRDNAGG